MKQEEVVPEATEKEQKQFRKRIEKTRVDREMKQFDDTDFENVYGSNLSAAEWTRQSRVIEDAGGRGKTKYQREIERKKKERLEAEYGGNDLEHISIAHNAENLKSGVTILTLKDKKVFDDDGDEDVLESLQLVRERKDLRNKIRRGGDLDLVDPLGDRFNTMLHKYGEELPEESGFKLSNTDLEKAEKMVKKTIEEKLVAEARKLKAQTLDGRRNFQSEIMNDTEMKRAGFKKMKKRKKKKRKRTRVVMKEIVVEETEENSGAGKEKKMVQNEAGKFKTNYDFLKALPNQKRHRGRRTAIERLKRSLDTQKDEEDRAARYQRAIDEAEANNIFLMEEDESDDDLDLQTALRRSKALSSKNENQEEQSIADVVNSVKKSRQQRKKRLEHDKLVDNKDQTVFTTASHFAQSLKDAMDFDDNRTKRDKSGDEEEDVIVEISDPALRAEKQREKAERSKIDDNPLVKHGLAKTMEYVRNRGFHKDHDYSQFVGIKERREKPSDVTFKRKLPFVPWTNEELCVWAAKNEMKHLVPVFKKFKVCGKDMQATRTVLKRCWALSDYDLALYKRKVGEMTGDTCPEIQLQYIGTHGKPMTKNDAFRSMSHIFHGKKPGKKNTEKRLRRHQEERVRKTVISSTDTPLGTLTRQADVMATDAKAYIVLEGDGGVRISKDTTYTRTGDGIGK